MKSSKAIVPFLLILVIIMPSTSKPSQAFIVEKNKITIYNIGTSERTLNVGDVIDVYMYIKNYSNYTLQNVTIIQHINGSFDLGSSPYKAYNGTDEYFNESNAISVRDELSQSNIALTAMNMTASNFTMSISNIFANDSYVFKFSVNATEEGTGIIDKPRMNYLDNYLDEQSYPSSDNDGYTLEYTINEISTYPINGYFPEVEVAELEISQIILIGVGILVLGLIGRTLYFKKPFEI